MNKFVKYGSIFGFVFILTGVGVSATAFALGANVYELERNFRTRVDFFHEPVSDRTSVTEAALEENIGDLGSGWHSEYENLTKLKIDQRGGTMRIQVSDEVNNLMIDGDNGDIDRTIYEDDGFEQKLTVKVRDNDNYVVTIPYAWTLAELDVEVYEGLLEAVDISAAEAEFHAGGGTINVTQLEGGTLELEADENGTINWSGRRSLIPLVYAESEGGIINITLPDGYDLSLYNLKAECEDGTIQTPDMTLEGIDKKRISGDGTSVMDIEAKNFGIVTLMNGEES